MTTRFLLHGGRLRYKDTRNDTFFKAVIDGLEDGDKVLFVGFARRDDDDRKKFYERDKKFILAQTDKAIDVINATYDDFIEQIREAKAIFITGGETPDLVNDIKRYPNFLESIHGKVIAGSSAGACLFSTYYFYNQHTDIMEGLGILPIKLMVHYGNEEFYGTAENLKILEEYANDLELVALEECEWIVREDIV